MFFINSAHDLHKSLYVKTYRAMLPFMICCKSVLIAVLHIEIFSTCLSKKCYLRLLRYKIDSIWQHKVLRLHAHNMLNDPNKFWHSKNAT